MKLLKITIENITSLKGKHIIDFAHDLQQENLFAVTGPTGSGKSSILTAISLALYGNNYKSNLAQEDFVSLGEKQAFIELYFAIKGEEYKVQWECKARKSNGELLKKSKIKKTLFHGDIALDISCEELIGLTFDQFCKTVILNQGQFAQFLTSTFRERKDILEKLYDGEHLSMLSKKLREKLKAYKLEIDNINLRIESSLPYSDSEYKETNKLIIESEKELIIIEKRRTNLSIFKDYIKEIVDLENRKKNLSADYLANENRLESTKKINNEIKKEFNIQDNRLVEAENHYSEKLPILNNAIKDMETLRHNNDQLQKNQSQIIVKQNFIKKESESIYQLKIKLDNNEDDIKKLVINKELDSLSDNQIRIIKESVSKLNDYNVSQKLSHQKSSLTKNRIISLEKNIHSDNLKLEESIRSINNLIKNYSNITNQDMLKESININNIEENYRELVRTLEKHKDEYFESHSKIRTTIDKVIQKNILFEENLKNIHNEKIKNKELLSKKENLNLKLQNISINIKSLEQKKTILKLQKSINDCIDASLTASKCIVCSSEIEGVILKKKQISDIDSFNDESDQKANEYHNVNNLLSITLENILNSSNLIDKLSKENDAQQRLLTLEINNQLDEKKLSDISSSNNFSFSDVSQAIELLKKMELELLENYKTADRVIKSCNSTYQDYKYAKNNIKELITEKNTNMAQQDETDEYIKNISESIKKVNQAIIEMIPSYRMALDEISEKLDYDINTINKRNELNSITIKINDKINFSNLNIQRITLEINDISEAVKELDLNSKKLQSSIIIVSKNLNPEEDLNQLNHSLQYERQKHNKLRKENEESDQKLCIQLEKGQFITKEISKSQNEQDSIYIAISNNNNLISFLDKNNYNINNKNMSNLDELLDLVSNHLNLCIEEFNNTLQLKAKYKNIVQIYEEKIKQQIELKNKLADLQKNSERLEKLTLIMGRDEFRNFALGIIEHQLIAQTNNEMKSLCSGRYELKQVEKKLGHDFYITDFWRGGLERKVSTLSGGETFLVSLGMALALAEMTRGKIEIDSFFIDEGFGTLDPESIEEVLNTLMSMRERGKQIGIISHIKELTKRIPANINLEKSQFGTSKINIFINQ